jgi:hypothetical protein
MEWTLLIISEAQIDVVGIKPSKQQVIKGDGIKKMTIRNERLVGELEPRKTRLEAQPPMSNMTPPQVLLMDTRKKKTHLTTPQVMWRPPTASPSTSTQPTPSTPSPPVPVQSLRYLESSSGITRRRCMMYATEECHLVEHYMGEERTGCYIPTISRV